MAMKKSEVWAEMARRKVQFHPNEEWQTIRLWGLFNWGDVSKFLKTGELLTTYSKENKTIWVTPSKEAYEQHILPLIEEYDLDQLTQLAGWQME